ncbi:SMP-30/gluconolactonase/LRE family protein [candidate division KSB1 bacterium]|nr:SMP-30/gluconolactonase/LRE family protein [candidate division KSB1 bacterium]
MNFRISFSRIIISCIICLMLIHSQLMSQSPLDPNAEVEVIATGIQQPEGPVWKDGLGLLFSDIKGNKIYKWTDENGKEVYLNPSDSTNGLTYDLQGRLVAGQMGLRRIVRFEEDGSQTSLANRYDGKRFSSPNDLVVKSDGSIFFTDPDFNIPPGQHKELSFNGIYRISPSGKLQLLTTLALPNGICFSPDELKLYVNDSQAHKIYVWDVVDDSTIANKKLLYTIPTFGYADGMKIDDDGNIYCTCSSAVWVVSPSGELLGKINLPANVSASNCAWGEADNKTLFITAGTSVYKVRPLVTSVGKHNSNLPDGFELLQNYPNPFNPSTNIAYTIPNDSKVIIKVYDVIGTEVAMIENSERTAGTYNVRFNAKQLASGVYYYRLLAHNYSATKKFILMK